jgi:hypothetical protein
MSNFTMGTIVGKGFAQAQVHTEGTSAMNCMNECLSKTLSQKCPHGKIAFFNSDCIYNVCNHALFCFTIQGKKGRQKNCMPTMGE